MPIFCDEPQETNRHAPRASSCSFSKQTSSSAIHTQNSGVMLLPDGTSLNEIMIRNGAAYFYPHQDLSPQLQERLRNLQHEAIAGRRGMWAFLLSQPVAKNTYLGNKESLRFFPADCAEASTYARETVCNSAT